MVDIRVVVEAAVAAGVVAGDAQRLARFLALIEGVRLAAMEECAAICLRAAEHHHLTMWECRRHGMDETAALEKARVEMAEQIKTSIRLRSKYATGTKGEGGYPCSAAAFAASRAEAPAAPAAGPAGQGQAGAGEVAVPVESEGGHVD